MSPEGDGYLYAYGGSKMSGSPVSRRDFLRKSFLFILGSLSCPPLVTASACEDPSDDTSVRPAIALIIDDIGESIFRAEQFLALEVPITFSVLPWLTHSGELARLITGCGHELMLHQPMEPHNSRLDPGPGALRVGFEKDTITRIMEENLSSIPGTVGVNNHMGSKFTECPREVEDALNVVKRNELIFVDSRTSHRSLAYRTARMLHLEATSRNIFLDNRPDEDSVTVQLRKLERHALHYGTAVGIGHPFIHTARALARFLPDLARSGVSLVYISGILDT